MTGRLIALVLLSLLPAWSDAAVSANGMSARIEAMFRKLPQEKLHRAAGFFAPVVKRHLPSIRRFGDEYLHAKDKPALILRYVPEFESMVREAHEMKVPARYEAEKADYLKTADAFLAGLKMLKMLYSQG